MIDACTIKSNPHGLTLVLDKDADFETLIREVCGKFAESKNFFGKADLILHVEGRELTGQELSVLVEAIELNSLIHIILIEENDQLKDTRMVEMADRFYFDEFYQNAKIVTGSVKKDEALSSDGSILILGNIQKGGLVEARGNIIVCGEIRGGAHAGASGEKKAYIVANEFDSTDISIAGNTGEILTAKKSFFRKPSAFEPAVVVLWQGTLLKESLSAGVIKRLVS
ncbi:MAG: hypothetical protein IJV04_00845 [Lachnospiraceae bacterium]|nr:hypothetical protein [Lachnospiraceae bacterium]